MQLVKKYQKYRLTFVKFCHKYIMIERRPLSDYYTFIFIENTNLSKSTISRTSPSTEAVRRTPISSPVERPAIPELLPPTTPNHKPRIMLPDSEVTHIK